MRGGRDGTGGHRPSRAFLSAQRPLRCAGSFPRKRRCRGRPCLCPGPAERQPRVGRPPHLPFCEWERCGRPGLRRGEPPGCPAPAPALGRRAVPGGAAGPGPAPSGLSRQVRSPRAGLMGLLKLWRPVGHTEPLTRAPTTESYSVLCLCPCYRSCVGSYRCV